MPLSNDTWAFNTSADWSVAGDWSTGTVPNSNDDAIINTASVQTITHNGGADTVHSLTVGDDNFVMNGGSLTFLAGASFATNYTQYGGTLLGAGTVSIGTNGYLLGGGAQGTLNFAIGGTIALANYTLGGATVLTNNSATNQTGQITIGDNTGVNAKITNSALATYTIAGDFGISDGAATATFVNAGALEKTAGSGTSIVGVSITDTGTISVANGLLQFDGPSDTYAGAITGAGSFGVGGGGSHQINAGTTIATSVFDVYDGGTVVNLNENLSFANTFNQGYGSDINLHGHTLTLSGAASFADINFGIPTVNGSGTLATSGTTTLDIFTLGGTVNWNNTGTVNEIGSSTIGDGSANAATFTNAAAGHFNFAADVNLEHGASAVSSFVNSGTIAKIAGNNTSFFDVDVTSTGTVSAATGSLEFRGPTNSFGGTITGAGQVALGGGSANTIANATTLNVATFSIYDSGTSVKLLGNLAYSGVFNQGYGSTINLNGHVLTLSGTADFYNSNFGAPTINGSGTVSSNAATTWSDFVLGGTVNWRSNSVVSATLTNYIGDAGSGAATYTNLGAGQYNITNDSSLERGAATTSSFANAGLLAKTAGTGTSYVDVDYSGAGKISVASGTLYFRGPADTFSGAISGAGQFVLGGGDVDTIASGATITASSFSIYDNGTSVTLAENLTYGGSYTQAYGTTVNLGGNTLTLSGQASFFNANFATPTVNGSGTLATTGTTMLNDLIIGGTVNWANSGTASETYNTQIGDGSANGATLTNQSGGKFYFVNDSGFARGTAATSSIVNAGSIIKSGGTGVSVIGLNVSNTGVIESQTGSIDIAGALTGNGTLKIDAGAKIEVGSSVAVGTTATFGAATGTLQIDSLAAFSGAVTGFAAGDVIDLGLQGVKSLQYSGSVVTVTFTNNTTQTLALTGSVATLSAISDGASGTDIVAAANPFTLTSGADILAGTTAAMTVYGTAATLNANDSLVGGSAVDTLSLSGGGNFNLAALEAFSLDKVLLSAGANYNLTLGAVDVAAGHTLTVNGFAVGAANTVEVNGSAVEAGATLSIVGGAGADTLIGGAGANAFNGDGGNDTITGGSGANTYVFTTALNAATNDPSITNFNVATDKFNISHTVFTALTAGALPAADFAIGASATTASQHILYNSATGALLYDPDGSGSQAAVQFAQLSTGLALTASMFKVT